MSWIYFTFRVFGLVIAVVCYLAVKEIWDQWSERRSKEYVKGRSKKKIWLFVRQGLRGTNQALSGARKSDLPHWKPWLADDEKARRSKLRLYDRD